MNTILLCDRPSYVHAIERILNEEWIGGGKDEV